MAKKQDRISINKLEKYCNKHSEFMAVTEKSLQINDEVVTYKIRHQLTLEECIRFVNDVINECISTSDTMFIPMAKRFIINQNVMTYYGNFTMPDDVNKAFELVMASGDIIDSILNTVNISQFNMICEAIEASVEFETKKMLSAQEQRVNEVISEVKQFTDRMTALFDGVNGDQMSGFIQSISQMPEVTAEDLANAIVSRPQ